MEEFFHQKSYKGFYNSDPNILGSSQILGIVAKNYWPVEYNHFEFANWLYDYCSIFPISLSTWEHLTEYWFVVRNIL